MELTARFTMVRCNSNKLSFKKMASGDHKAFDVFCGIPYEDVIWYCSEKCKNDTPKLKYKNSNEEISND